MSRENTCALFTSHLYFPAPRDSLIKKLLHNDIGLINFASYFLFPRNVSSSTWWRNRDKFIPGQTSSSSSSTAVSRCMYFCRDHSKARIRVVEGCVRGYGGEEKARERGKAHRRLTRIYGFVGLANKESARETGFRRATLFSLGIACCRSEHENIGSADISDIVARVNGQRERRIYGHARLHEARICAR